jgi:hypothetical protein
LKSGTIGFSDDAAEVSDGFLVAELQENNPTNNSVTMKALIFWVCAS